jgi:YidC/Oxa1 family membrane protein insertase
MDRKGILIILIVIAGAFSYNYFITAPKQKQWVEYQKKEKERLDAEQKLKDEQAKAAAAAAAANAPVVVSIQVQSVGATPETLKEKVGAPLEKAVEGLENLTAKTSEVAADIVTLKATFKPGTDAAKAVEQLKAKCAEIQPALPPEARLLGVEAAKPPAPVVTAAPPVAPTPVVPVETTPAKTERMASEPGTVEYEFTEEGGGISSITLKDHLMDKKKGRNVVLNEFGKIPIGTITEALGAVTETKPGEPAGKEAQLKYRWKMTSDEAARTVTFERVDTVYNIKITKKFSLPRKSAERKDQLRNDYVVKLDITCENVGAGPIKTPAWYLHLGGAAPVTLNDQNIYQGVDWWREGSNHFQMVDWTKESGWIFKTPAKTHYQADSDLIRWAAVTSQYFTTMVTILGAEEKTDEERRRLLGTSVWAKHHDISLEEWKAKGHITNGGVPVIHHVDVALAQPDITLLKPGEPGSTVTRSYQIYAGPREYRRLRLLDHKESDVLDYGTFLGIPTGPFSRLLLNSMNGLYNLVGHYALAIVLLTLIVKGILWPLQSKANNSMKKMSALQPQLKELQEKYKGDPQKFQQEMAKMWKKAGVNPLSGCWPILIQIPIFIGFYNMLGKAVELRYQGFWWVNDLSAPDTVGDIFGLPINPLPLLMAGTMFLQMKLAPQGGDPTQRKIFMFMPLIFVLLCYNFASALALYWTVQNIISIVQLYVNRKVEARRAQPMLVK